jgi:ATP-binding cassette subfamily C protein
MPAWFLVATLPPADRWKLALYVMLSLASAIAGAAAAVLFVPLVQPGASLPFLARLPMHAIAGLPWFVAATLAFALSRWQASRLGARLVGRYGMRLRQQVHARLLKAELATLADASSAEIANVLTYNVETIVQGFSAMQQLLVAGVTAAISLSLAFWVSPPLILAAPPLVVIGLLASRFFGREQLDVGRRYVADMTRLFWHAEEFPRRLRHVRSFTREKAEQESFGAVARDLAGGYARQLELIASGRLVLELVAVGGIALVFILARRWHGVDTASLIAVCLLLGRLMPYLVSTRQSLQQMHSAAPALALWRRYMGLEEVLPPASDRQAMSIVAGIDVRQLRVSPPVPAVELHDVYLRPGELVLVRGDSGIGKSSLIDVLAGMGCPELFDVRVDGRPVDYAAYRTCVARSAYVGQGVRPWQATVRECLRWVAPDASDATMHEVLRDVGLAMRLSGEGRGLDTPLHDASNRLSGGEMQRLLLAQVMLREPVIALLDEATSALDAASELAVLAALRRRLPHGILVVVSHRDGVAALADQCVTVAPTIRSIVPSRAGA